MKRTGQRFKNTVDAVGIPVIANGDITSEQDARDALELSAAHGVMIGRAALGQPWLVGQISAALEGGSFDIPNLEAQCDSLCEQIEDSQALYGRTLGLRTVRKHVSAPIDHVGIELAPDERRRLRAELCRLDDAAELIQRLQRLYYNNSWDIAA